MAAIQRLIQNGYNYTKTILELGYPKSTVALRNWYNEYRSTGELHQKNDTERKYSKEDRDAAVKHYLENGHSITQTVRESFHYSPLAWIIHVADEAAIFMLDRGAPEA
jgi:transposase-like protein